MSLIHSTLVHFRQESDKDSGSTGVSCAHRQPLQIPGLIPYRLLDWFPDNPQHFCDIITSQIIAHLTRSYRIHIDRQRQYSRLAPSAMLSAKLPDGSLHAENLYNISGLVAVITGGGAGIGAMMATALAENGAHKVYIIGRREGPLQELAAKYPAYVALHADSTPASSHSPYD